MVYENKKGESIRVYFPDKKGKFVIPEFLGDYQCKIIEAEEFIYSKVTEVVIPEGVTSIGRFAFKYCYNLDIVINNSKFDMGVGEDAFYECNSVKWLK